MTDSFELDEPALFTAGTVGPPGARAFYLQAAQADRLVTLKVEKQQVAALCEYLAGILADLPPTPDEPVGTLDLIDPVEPAWSVGTLAVAYEATDDRILLVAEELVVIDDDLDELAELGLDLPEPASARFHLRRHQVRAFIDHGLSLVAAGRSTCRLCQKPIDPAGHHCARLN